MRLSALVTLGVAMTFLAAPARSAGFFGTGNEGTGFFGTFSATGGNITAPAILLLEMGGDLLLENGGKIQLEGLPGFLLLDGASGGLLLEDGGKVCLQGNVSC